MIFSTLFKDSFDELDRFVGMINGFNEKMQGIVYMVDSNKVFKVADSIVKTGNYEVNYIKYSLEGSIL